MKKLFFISLFLLSSINWTIAQTPVYPPIYGTVTGAGALVLQNSPSLSYPSLGTTGLTVTATTSSNVTQYLAVTRGSGGTVSVVTLSGAGFQGFAQSTVTSGNPVEVCYIGTCTCIADNTVTAGDLLGTGATSAGRCRDLGTGQNSALQGNVAIWGKAITGGSAGSNISINAVGPGHFGSSINYTMATTPLSLTGGVYSFDSQGTGGVAVVQVSGGSVSSILTWGISGSGYAVGDLITPGGGNNDALIVITAVNGSNQPTAGAIVYGGTGYAATGGYNALMPTSSLAFTFLLSGTLASNATLVMTNGTYLSQSNQWIFANNTTGNYTVTVCVAGATDSCSGGRTVVLPQGTNNSTSMFLQTDGVANVDYVNQGLRPSGTITLTTATSDSLTVPGITSSSHCWFAPSNSTATLSTILPWISWSTATVTINHAATVAIGATETFGCSLY